MSEQDISKDITTEQEKALLEKLRFKVAHCNAVVLTTPNSNKEDLAKAEDSLNALVSEMMERGYSREKLEGKICSYWGQLTALYNGKRNVKEVL